MTIHWQEITASDSPFWMQALALYDATFPLEVREPPDVFLRSMQQKDAIRPSAFHFLIGLSKTERVAGLAVFHYLSTVNFGFIVYILVDSSLRGQGIGLQLHEQIESILQTDAMRVQDQPLRGLVLETEKAELATTAEEIGECQKRTRFFTKLGYRQVQTISYLQPPLHPLGEAVPLHLFVKLLDRSPSLTYAELGETVHAIYSEKYGGMNQIEQPILRACEQHFQTHLKTHLKIK